MKPKFRKMSQECEGVTFVVVDSEKFPDSRKMAEVDNLPTFAAFKDGSLVNQVQTNKADVLKEFVDEATSN
jgi:thioredoxin-like negative regulator of GroEL